MLAAAVAILLLAVAAALGWFAWGASQGRFDPDRRVGLPGRALRSDPQRWAAAHEAAAAPLGLGAAIAATASVGVMAAGLDPVGVVVAALGAFGAVAGVVAALVVAGREARDRP